LMSLSFLLLALAALAVLAARPEKLLKSFVAVDDASETPCIWALAAPGENCDEGCAHVERVCPEEQMRKEAGADLSHTDQHDWLVGLGVSNTSAEYWWKVRAFDGGHDSLVPDGAGGSDCKSYKKSQWPGKSTPLIRANGRCVSPRTPQQIQCDARTNDKWTANGARRLCCCVKPVVSARSEPARSVASGSRSLVGVLVLFIGSLRP